uniref:Small G protein signaling modulator 1b n=1 Tax=Neogobius melanostomus TaxID=47308 RepID=A0A8C6TQF1_9GOBI
MLTAQETSCKTKDRLFLLQVKQIMEEAVTRKFVHADSSHIISFCAVVEACLLHGLKRRIAGLLCSNKVAAVFMKVAKNFSPAEQLCQKVQELEQLIENNSSQNNERSRQAKLGNLPPQALKHLWIRTALMEKLLDKIVLYLVENFWDHERFLFILLLTEFTALLTVGPCALEYTKVKTADHFWTDPSADELVQRHRIHSGHSRQDSPSRRPALIQKRQSSGSMDDRPLTWVREYVESLHQNSRTTLLFGKNNVLVQPRDDMEVIPGYLSLHQTADVMTLKWTPNQLMNGNMGEMDSDTSVYWDYAMTIRLEEIVYLHCHQQVNSGGTVVLVSQDGIQKPPLHFPKGGHLLQFLTCLETGLLPHGQLDPPLWNQRGKGKIFPKLRKRSPHGSCDSVSDKEDDEATDYVFRILFPGSQMEFNKYMLFNLCRYCIRSCVFALVALELMDEGVNMWQPTQRESSCSSCSQNGSSDSSFPNGCSQERAPIKLLCDTMKYQIISRAFYGWLAYCRHLSTVRTHLSALIKPTIVDPDVPTNARTGLSREVWGTFLQTAYEEKEIHRLVYYGGVTPSLRKEVWPFLLGHYHFTMTETNRIESSLSSSADHQNTHPLSDSSSSAQQEQLDMYLINLHRIDKDVRRCDRTYWYFSPENLEKLRNIMCSYVWLNLDIGYVQGMCDLLAPLLVILDDEVIAFSCFTELMKRMNQNFPHGGAMDTHFANMRSLIQILDSELFELMQQNGDYTHFYFCYRWFLLDFKREMVYDDVFSVWETIWAAMHTSSEHFVLFIALALVEMYRDIILENNMDFTDIIKFFNEMAERHDVPRVLNMARDLVHKVQTLIENK